MPPRLPARAIPALPLVPNPVASSSARPLPAPARRQLHARPLRRGSLGAQGARPQPSWAQHSRFFHASAPSAASAKNPYEVLGVGKDASTSDIKKAYYALAKKLHPDTNKEAGSAEKFHDIQNAYDILSDDSKRQAYDRYGSASQQEGFDADAFARGAGGFGGFQDFGAAFGGRGGNAGDLFESLFGSAFSGGGGGPFGGGGGRARPVRGDDLEAAVTLSFLEACAGVQRTLNITPVVDCKTCTGSGLKPGEKKQTCSTCRGTGQQAFQVQGMYMASTCQACGGAGSTIPRAARCGDCEGVGRVKERREVSVDVPAGIEDGMKIKIPGAGDMPLSASGPPGDLYVRVNVKPSAVFRRQGTNLYHEAKVPLHTALLGGRIRIPTLEGDVDVRVREGTQNGEEAVLKGRGVKSVYPRGPRNERGDLIVGWKVQIPRSLSPFQKKILQAYADDVEGRTPKISFDQPKEPKTEEPGQGEARTSRPARPPPPAEPEPPRPPRAERPLVEPERRPVPGEAAHAEHAEHAGGLGDKLASAVGGALGWAERLFGRDDKGGGGGGGGKR